MECNFDQDVLQQNEQPGGQQNEQPGGQQNEQPGEQSPLRPDRPKRRRSGPLPPWVLVFCSLLFYVLCFHIWTEDRFSVGRFLTLTLLSLSFAMFSALLGTVTKRRKYQRIFALAVVILWAVLFLAEYFILDFYTLEGMLTGAGNAGHEDFKDRTVDLLLKNIWRILLFALPVVGWFLANRYLKLRRILTRGVRRYLAAGGGILLAAGLLFGLIFSPDWKRMGKEYNFTDAVHGFGLPMGFALDFLKSGGNGGEFDIPESRFVPITSSASAQRMISPHRSSPASAQIPPSTVHMI